MNIKSVDSLDVIPIDTEIVKTENKAEKSTAWIPPFPLTAHRLFLMALGISAIDPARYTLGFFYKSRLKRECALLVDQPIYRHNVANIRNALYFRRTNADYFVCSATDIILNLYLNNMEN